MTENKLVTAEDGGRVTEAVDLGRAEIRTVGLRMPDDFPVDSYERIWSRLQPLQQVDDARFWECGLAWNGIAYRFKAAADHSADFTEAIRQGPSAPPPDLRYRQERELFGFFVNGLAAIECFAYGGYFVGSFVVPGGFPFVNSERHRKRIGIETVEAEYRQHSNGEPIATVLTRLIADTHYDDWRKVRNILAHRAHPGRNIFMSTRPNAERPDEWRVPSPVAIDLATTASRQAWLAGTLGELLDAMETFVSRHL